MKTKVIDFYSGFEGEPGVQIFQEDRQGNIPVLIKIWDGYFRDIIEEIVPNTAGYWEGVALVYHLHEGWYAYEIDRWECEDLALLLSQLSAINVSEFGMEESN